MNLNDFGENRSRSKTPPRRRNAVSSSKSTYSPVQWRVAQTGVFQECTVTHRRLPAGSYTCEESYPDGLKLLAKSLKVDDLICVPEGPESDVLQEIQTFWAVADRYLDKGFLHRRGILLYGPHGSGKSSLVHQVVQQAIHAGHVAFFCQHPSPFIKMMELFRKIEPDRAAVCVFEDIDAIIKESGDADILQWLDGTHQVNHVVNLATTNYPEELDRRLVARPRRFDRIIKIDQTPADARESYLAKKLPELTAGERKRWLEASEGLSIAALAELVVSVMCLGQAFEDVLHKLRTMDQSHPSSKQYRRDSLGFALATMNGESTELEE